ncbi:hypothetical protein CkaCkLH20_04702 [Colletotrichum karsti]|uniref:DUF7587 domain-containing protein n=1 Tax=Colletotrichum karsti TaxID=1095194 RepID=A0A9P6I8B1_9PEZI|nr:uncharacterized protein CkaCkLH20_04702 [Colletotrichum karsti]KAF9877567.1 hypothetical protein CkaCkLH20_04702 [Colletotrichum karsti]
MAPDSQNDDGPILFKPDTIPPHAFPQHEDLKQCVDNIPRYLFRVTSPQSAGATSVTEVCSRAWLNNASDRNQDLFAYSEDFSPSLIAQKLEDHLLCMLKFDSNLVSWTSSLLFALHYAVYRHYLGERLEDLSLLVVDTTQFQRGTIIRDHLAIKAFESYSVLPADGDGLKILHKWRNGHAYFGEYLSQGRLPLDPKYCAQVTMQKLHEEGLVSLYPSIWYRDLPATWCGALLVLRAEVSSASRRMEERDVLRAMNLAKTFPCRDFHLPMTFMFLSLCPRNIDDSFSLLLQESMLESDEFSSK